MRLASRFGRYGYRRVTDMLRIEGWGVKHKRVERIWRQEGLKVPERQPKRGRLWLNDGSCIRLRPLYRGHVWSYDFVASRTHDGRALKLLTVLDEHTRECLAIVVARKIRAHDVLEVLADLFVRHGPPEYLRSDNGPEFTAKLVRRWLGRVGVETLFIEPGSPWENGFPLTMSLAAMEVEAIAAATGAEAQLAHLISSTVGSAPLSIALVEGAYARGVDVGFDFHVWTRNQTTLQSALFDEGWQERFGGAAYSDIYVAESQERLTEERFFELRARPGGLAVQTEFIPEEEMIMGLTSPLGIVSSDGGGLVNGRGHPRSVGTFGRFLGRFVRDLRVVSWMEGIRKITLLPAGRLERAVPRMARKGRLQVGMDADVTVFDPTTVQERATYGSPAQMSEGISYVIVNGTLVLDGGTIVEGVVPGQWLRHPRPVS